jgi:formate--tetrahydrofolate ligase
LGPVFGVKGGGAGGGKAHLLPLDEINLHLTGDTHAVVASHNLLAALVDNHLYHGNKLEIDPGAIWWPRASCIGDRSLRRVQTHLMPAGDLRSTEFVIAEATEVMAVLALASGLADLRKRLGRISIGLTKSGHPVAADQLRGAGSMAVLLREALLPNLVQTVEGTPAFVHAGPFGNIAHGNSSVVADALALRCADFVITEAGFGSELGAEKFFNIKCRVSGLRPDTAVVVATLRALKLHGGAGEGKAGKSLARALAGPNREALTKGLANLGQHIENVKAFGVPPVVSINAFGDDSPDELRLATEWARDNGAFAATVSTQWADGGAGAEALAHEVIRACEMPSRFHFLYEEAQSIEDKIETIAVRMYGAAGVTFHEQAKRQIALAERLGLARLPVCIAKTPFSLSHDPTLKGKPTGFTVPVKELRILSGAGFLTAVCSGIQLMPGLPKWPAAERIDVDPATGSIVGLV